MYGLSLVARLCTFSSFLISPFSYGLQADAVNSRRGLTHVVYSVFTKSLSNDFKVLLNIPRTLFVLYETCWIWFFHLRSEEIKTPKSLSHEVSDKSIRLLLESICIVLMILVRLTYMHTEPGINTQYIINILSLFVNNKTLIYQSASLLFEVVSLLNLLVKQAH
jgi:hypothetical protein